MILAPRKLVVSFQKLSGVLLLKEKDLTIAPREIDSVVRQTYLPLAALTSSFFTQHCLLMSDYLQQFEIKAATKMVNFKDVKKGDYLEMAAYSIDLRQKILIAWQNKQGT